LPYNGWGHDFLHRLSHLVANVAIFVYVGKVLGKGICAFISSAAVPIGSKVLPSRFDYFPYVVDVLLGSRFEMALGLANISFATSFAFKFVDYHAFPTDAVVHAATILQ